MANKTKEFRKAVESDVVVGNVFHYPERYGDPAFESEIEEALRLSDPYKAFHDTDGCRHGLKDAMIEVHPSKKIKLWKWPEEEHGRCTGCYFHKGECTVTMDIEPCSNHIYKTEKPEPEFIEVEVEE